MRTDLRSSIVLLALGASTTLAFPAPRANPMPPAGFMIHIQSPDMDACAAPPVAHCPEIVQYTESSGPLEFSVFAYPWALAGWETLCSVDVDVQWPVSWALQEWDLCPGPEATVELGAAHARLHLVWPDCPLVPENGLVLLGRFVLEVDGHGVVWAEPVEAGIGVGCPPDVEPMWGVPGRAEAGVVCGYCFNLCNLNGPCEPQFSQSTLEVDLAPGETTVAAVDIVVAGWGEDGLCCYGTQLESDAPWLAGWVECADPFAGIARVSLDATQLAPGSYSATLKAVADCVGCLDVILTVGYPQGVPEGEGESPPEDATPLSWGRLKGLFE